MKLKTKAKYSTGFIAKTILQYQMKAMGPSFYIAMLISLGMALFLILSRNQTILPAVFSGVSVLGVLIFLRMFALYFNGANSEFKKMSGDSVEIIFREQGISVGGSVDSLKWKDLHKVWMTEDAYLFFRSKDSFLICPSFLFDDEIHEFIERKIGEFRIHSGRWAAISKWIPF